MAEQSLPETQPSVALLDRPWFRALILVALNALVTIAVTSATLTWRGRDYLDARDDKIILRVEALLSHYQTKEDALKGEVERANKLIERLEGIEKKL